MAKGLRVSADNRRFLLVFAMLVVLTTAVYWRTFSHDFITYDDEQYVTQNQHVLDGLSWSGVKWAFTTSHASNWHPLTWMSHMLDCTLFGANPIGPHAVNLLLHLLNTVLLGLVLLRMTGSLWKSAFVAALFALHPMHVESVAWVAERKDLLSTMFMILVMMAYTAYIRKPRIMLYLLISVLMALGLLAKPTLVTLPILLLLLDYWPLRRMGEGGRTLPSLLVEKIPLFVLSAAYCVVTYWAQKTGGAVVEVSDRLTILLRLDNAVMSYVTYIGRLFYPHKMSIFYPHPTSHIPVWQVVAASVGLVVVTLLALRVARRHPYIPVGWLWFLVSLVPMIGLVQVGKAAMADRYTYISYIGLFMMIAWWIPAVVSSRLTRWVAVGSILVLIAFSIVTWRQLGYWRNAFTIFSHALAVTSNNDMAHISVGNYLLAHDKAEEAVPHYLAALKANPFSDRAHNNLGNAFAHMGKVDEAIREYKSALRLRANPIAHFNIALQLSRRGDLTGAVGHYEKAIEIDPEYAEAHIGLAGLFEQMGKAADAQVHYATVSQLLPRSAEAHYKLGCIMSKRGNPDGAVAEYKKALEIRPNYPEAHYNLGNTLSRKGDLDGAIREYNAAISFKPGYAEAHFNLGVMLDAKQDMPQAMKEYRLAVKLKHDYVEARINLAIDLFISGEYAESWKEVKLARKYGGKPHPGFVKALSAKMPEPAL